MLSYCASSLASTLWQLWRRLQLSHNDSLVKLPHFKFGFYLAQIRRKATPRELAEQFRGHGLKQAEWAPIPIYWAKDGSPAAAPDAVQREL